MGRIKGGLQDPKELLQSLPGRGRANIPPVPKDYYEYEWGIFATDEFLQQSLNNYINQKQEGGQKEIRYRDGKLDIYILPPEGIDFVKEKIKNLGLKKSEKNFILHKKLKPKTSQWALHLWK